MTEGPTTIRTSILELSAKLMDAAFNYWMNDHELVRCPFPQEIKGALKKKTAQLFTAWIAELTDHELKEMEANDYADMLEAFLFNEALSIVDDEEQKLTIIYPFMPRPRDLVNHREHGESTVLSRKEILKDDSTKMLEVNLIHPHTGFTYKTEFEIS